MGNCTRVRSTLGQWFPYLVKMNTVLSAPQMLAFVAVERRILQTPKVLEAVEQLFIGSKSIQTIMRELYSKTHLKTKLKRRYQLLQLFCLQNCRVNLLYQAIQQYATSSLDILSVLRIPVCSARAGRLKINLVHRLDFLEIENSTYTAYQPIILLRCFNLWFRTFWG